MKGFKITATLERTLYIDEHSKIEDEVIQVRCEKCGRRYDADVPECPYCEVERLKHRYRNF